MWQLTASYCLFFSFSYSFLIFSFALIFSLVSFFVVLPFVKISSIFVFPVKCNLNICTSTLSSAYDDVREITAYCNGRHTRICTSMEVSSLWYLCMLSNVLVYSQCIPWLFETFPLSLSYSPSRILFLSSKWSIFSRLGARLYHKPDQESCCVDTNVVSVLSFTGFNLT